VAVAAKGVATTPADVFPAVTSVIRGGSGVAAASAQSALTAARGAASTGEFSAMVSAPAFRDGSLALGLSIADAATIAELSTVSKSDGSAGRTLGIPDSSRSTARLR
jgi:hypothetical protein